MSPEFWIAIETWLRREAGEQIREQVRSARPTEHVRRLIAADIFAGFARAIECGLAAEAERQLVLYDTTKERDPSPNYDTTHERDMDRPSLVERLDD